MSFGNLPKISTLAGLITTGRSKNMFVMAMPQNSGQIKAKYEADADTVMAGFNAILFLAGKDIKLLSEFEKGFGDYEMFEKRRTDERSIRQNEMTVEKTKKQTKSVADMIKQDLSLGLFWISGENPILLEQSYFFMSINNDYVNRFKPIDVANRAANGGIDWFNTNYKEVNYTTPADDLLNPADSEVLKAKATNEKYKADFFELLAYIDQNEECVRLSHTV